MRHRCPAGFVFFAAFFPALAAAQSDLRVRNAPSPGPIADIIAITGTPYGVASIEIPVDDPTTRRELRRTGADDVPSQLRVENPEGRVLFAVSEIVSARPSRPASQQPLPEIGGGRLLNRVGDLIRELSDEARPQRIRGRRILFLFLGQEPLRVRVSDANGVIADYDVPFNQDRSAFPSLQGRWWQVYSDAMQARVEAAQHPPRVETYCTAMLANRLNLPLPTWYEDAARLEPPSESELDFLLETLQWLGGAERMRQHIFAVEAASDSLRSPLLGDEAADVAGLPLPPRIAWQPSDVGSLRQSTLLEANAKIEPLASRVPANCFYIRYGSFENFLWFQDLSQEYGGDLTQMVSRGAVVNDGAKRLEQQLASEMTVMGRMLGPTVITDQALIGRDLSLGMGSSMGVLMQASNAFLLRTSFATQRQQLASQDDEVTLTEEEILGVRVSVLRSADNRIRSFLAEDDGFFLISNSRSIVQDFLATGGHAGKPGVENALSETETFRVARALMPLDRDDTIFVYLSPGMLQGLLAPEYLIELRRRMRSDADIRLVQLAERAAIADGIEAASIDALVNQGYLPKRFDLRPDGSGVFRVGERMVDSMRGGAGSFVPIADVNVETITAEEARWYEQISSDYEQRFPRLDPIMVGIRREVIEDGNDFDPRERRERVRVDAEVAPWNPAAYGWWAKQLGPPTQVAMEFAPDDLVSIAAHVESATLGPATNLFVGIKDASPPPPEQIDGFFQKYLALRQLPGYLGAWPRPGALDRLPLGLGQGTPMGNGMSRLLGGVYRYTGNGFSVLSFQPEVLQATLPHLAAVDAADPAQVRVRVGNLSDSQLEGWVNDLVLAGARKSSVSGEALLQSLTRLLHVAPEETKALARRVYGGPAQCALGGEFEYDSASSAWRSTASSLDAYQAPFLRWFRGGSARVTQRDDRLSVSVDIVIARKSAK
ncbi:MAG: hypothetical protein AAGD07_08215 [Planctomycetota bacterium]